jgi:hypothetical protein
MSIPLGRILTAWVVIAVAMIANGIFRETLLKRVMSNGAAETLSVVLGVIIILLITRAFFRALVGLSLGTLAISALIFFTLTVAFEFLFGHYVDHKSWADLWANYEIWNGRLWPVALVIGSLTPLIWGKWFAPSQ